MANFVALSIYPEGKSCDCNNKKLKKYFYYHKSHSNPPSKFWKFFCIFNIYYNSYLMF